MKRLGVQSGTWGNSQAYWSPSGNLLVVVEYSGISKVYNLDTGEVKRLYDLRMPGNTTAGYAAFSPDEKRLAVTYWSSTQQPIIYDIETQQILLTYNLPYVCQGVAWSPDGSRLALGSENGHVYVPEVETEHVVQQFLISYPARVLTWTQDGKYLVNDGMSYPLSVLRVWQSTQELVDYARQTFGWRKLTAAEREQFGLPEK